MRIHGQIKDNIGSLSGVNVVLLSSNNTPTTIGTITDANGNFSLDRSEIKPNSTVQISYIGYYTILIDAKDLQGSTITMKENETILDGISIYGGATKNKWLWWLIPIAVGTTYLFAKGLNKPKIQPKRVKV